LDVLISDMSELVDELAFSSSEQQSLNQIMASERDGVQTLNAEASAITSNPNTSREEKQRQLEAIGYNDRLRALLRTSQADLQQHLGAEHYAELLSWLERSWQHLRDQHDALGQNDAYLTRTSANATSLPTCPTFTVFAQRSTDTDYSAGLPDLYLLLANRGIQYTAGYTNTTVYSVTIRLNANIAANVRIDDLGPHNINDNYWNTSTDPLHPRRAFKNAPHGKPEAQLAYFQNFNGGRNEFGQIVTSPAGIVVSQQVANQLGLAANGWVDVSFPWDCVPPSGTIPNPLEDAWGGEQPWSILTGQAVNPGTGNQTLQARDLYVAAPGLPIDIHRYYNSQDRSDSIFGRGWSSEYDMRVFHQPDGAYKVRYKNGRRGVFLADPQGGFSGAAGVFDQFVRESDGFLLTTTDRIIYRFNMRGRLEYIRDFFGNQTTLHYENDQLIALTDSVGRSYQIAQDGAGHITQITDPIGRIIRYNYSAVPAGLLRRASTSPSAGQASGPSPPLLISAIDPNGGTTTYAYDPATLVLNRATDAEGIVFVENVYDEKGRVREQRDRSGQTGTFVYDDTLGRTTFTDTLGRQTVYFFDSSSRLIHEQDALGNVTSYRYDVDNNMIERRDKRGSVWFYAYDSHGNKILQQDPIDRPDSLYTIDRTRWEYNDYNQIVKSTNALNQITLYNYDGLGNLVEVIEPDGSVTRSTYNQRGQLTSVTDAEGRISHFEYGSLGNLHAFVAADGAMTTYSHDAISRIISQINAEGGTIHYQYDNNGNTIKQTDALGASIVKEYDRNNLLRSVTDRRGARFEYRYDASLNLIEERDPLNFVKRTEYDSEHNRIKVIDAKNNVTSFTYDALNRLTQVTDPRGGITQYEYDANGNLLRTIDALKAETRAVYDAVGRRIFSYDVLSNETSFWYDQLDRQVQVFDARKLRTQYTYDLVGNMIQVTNADMSRQSFRYDRVHNRVAMIDENSYEHTFVYDARNREVARRDAVGQTTTTTYDRLGNVRSITDPNHNTYQFSYNANSWLETMTDPLKAITRYGYDAQGNRTSVTDPNGHTTRTTFDLRGDPVVVTDPLGFTTRKTYDANGNTLVVVDRKGLATRYTYDPGNAVISVVDPEQHTTQYDYDLLGRVVRRTDANHHPTDYQYDPLGRLITVIDAAGQQMAYSYDADGNLTVMADSRGGATRFEYNERNLLAHQTDAHGNSWTFAYDAAGHVIERVDGRQIAIRHEYDPAGRLIKTSYPDGKAISYAYDGNDNVIAMADWNGITRTTYDAADRPTTTIDQRGRQLTRSYDAGGNLIALSYPDARVVRYDYTSRDEQATMTDPDGGTTSFGYDPVGRPLRQLRPNKVDTERVYDAVGRLIAQSTTTAKGNAISRYRLTLDGVGNRTQVADERQGLPAELFTYAYDGANRLVRAASKSGERTYTYDTKGNRDQVRDTTSIEPRLPQPPSGSPAAPKITYTYDADDALLSAGQTTFRYDENGNRVQSTTPLSQTVYADLGRDGALVADYTYDIENRLVEARHTLTYRKGSAHTPTSIVVMDADYSYDGLGRRIAKLVQSYNPAGKLLETLLREYLYNGTDVVAEYEYMDGESRPNIMQYYYANGEKVAFERRAGNAPAQRYWYTYDTLGSVDAILDAEGSPVTQYRHDEFGQLLVGDTRVNRFIFTGNEYDAETGLVHFLARPYDAEHGVWLSRDPIQGNLAIPGTVNRYSYTANNPVNLVDPLGYWFGSDAWDWATGAAEDAANWAAGAAEDAWDWTKGAAEDAWDWTVGAAEDAWDWTKGAAEDAWDWTKGAAEDAWDWTKGAAEDAWDWTKGAAEDAWDWTKGAVVDAISFAGKALAFIGTWALTIADIIMTWGNPFTWATFLLDKIDSPITNWISFGLKAARSPLATTIGLGIAAYGLISGKLKWSDIKLKKGLLAFQFKPGSKNFSATTFGATVWVKEGDVTKAEFADDFEHELYHSYQFTGYGDTFFAAYAAGGVWGSFSATLAGESAGPSWGFGEGGCFWGVGNNRTYGQPMENIPEHINNSDNCK